MQHSAPKLDFDLSDATLLRIERDEFVAEAADILKRSHGARAGEEALTRARTCEAAGNREGARTWAAVFMHL